MKVYTYYNYVDCLKDPELISLWEKSWKRDGWEPVILTEEDAKNADPEMYARFNRSPLLESRNPPEYTRAAMLRWIPMTRVTEPCLHVDWDVFCNGLRPEQLVIHDPVPTFLSASTCPCAVAASPRGWKLFAALLEFAPFIPRFDREALVADSCDQYATSISNAEYYYIQPWLVCALYLENQNWKDAPMVHFPNRITPYPRSETIKNIASLFP